MRLEATMSVSLRLRLLTRLILLVTILAVPRLSAAQASADVVLEWNRILNTALATPGANPATVFATRPASIMSIAVFDALNSIDYQYVPYVSTVNVPQGASRDAAAAQAAHDVLVALMPSLTATYDAALANNL